MNKMNKKYCFLTEANYPNYVKRLKDFNLKKYLELNLDIPFYISTNLPDEFKEYENHPYIKVFDIEELRRNNDKSIINEPLPENPKGLYPAKYPWNTRRFILERACLDGYLGLFFIECDTRIKDGLNKESLLNEMENIYEPNTVKTSAAIFDYENRHPSNQLFSSHKNYINDLSLNFKDSEYNSLDGTNQLFFAENTEKFKEFFEKWHFITDYGYEKPYGYKTGYLSNLSFVIPMSGFKLKRAGNLFLTDHKFEDRY